MFPNPNLNFHDWLGRNIITTKVAYYAPPNYKKKKMHIARNENGQVQKQTWFNLFIFLFKHLNGASPRAGLNRGFS